MNERQNRYKSGKAKDVDNAFGKKIVGALADFTDALEKGEVAKRFSCRQIRLNLRPKPYSPELVRKTRRVLGVSQVLFARFIGVSAKTVRSWEQGINPPSKMACRFMDEIRGCPMHWMERLCQVTVRG